MTLKKFLFILFFNFLFIILAFANNSADYQYIKGLGFSDQIADRLASRPDLVDLFRSYGEDARAVKYYRGLGIEPEQYMPDRTGGIESKIWVSGDVRTYPFNYAVVKYKNSSLEMKKKKNQIAYGTIVEFEIPEFLHGGGKDVGWINYDVLPNQSEDMPLFNRRIGKVDIENAKRLSQTTSLAALDGRSLIIWENFYLLREKSCVHLVDSLL